MNIFLNFKNVLNKKKKKKKYFLKLNLHRLDLIIHPSLSPKVKPPTLDFQFIADGVEKVLSEKSHHKSPTSPCKLPQTLADYLPNLSLQGWNVVIPQNKEKYKLDAKSGQRLKGSADLLVKDSKHVPSFLLIETIISNNKSKLTLGFSFISFIMMRLMKMFIFV